MQIECPECHQAHTLSTEEFQNCDGITKCPDCAAEFDPLANLSEASEEPQPQKSTDTEPFTEFAWDKNKTPVPASFWSYGALAGLCLFSFQVFYFKHSQWVQNPILRPWLEKTCSALNCELPSYRNINEISVLHSSFTENNQKYTLQAAIKNQSEFPQHYPNLKLTLLNFSGSPIAKRVFQPQEYLNQNVFEKDFKKNETVTLKLIFFMLDSKVGGFTIELD